MLIYIFVYTYLYSHTISLDVSYIYILQYISIYIYMITAVIGHFLHNIFTPVSGRDIFIHRSIPLVDELKNPAEVGTKERREHLRSRLSYIWGHCHHDFLAIFQPKNWHKTTSSDQIAITTWLKKGSTRTHRLGTSIISKFWWDDTLRRHQHSYGHPRFSVRKWCTHGGFSI